MSFTIQENVELTTIVCGKCGVTFAMPERMREERQRNGGDFYCPNGHPRVYRETDVEKARKERDAALRKLSEKSCELSRERNAKESAERKLRRCKNGVCPCCRRSFQNLQRHMKSQHPDFAKWSGTAATGGTR